MEPALRPDPLKEPYVRVTPHTAQHTDNPSHRSLCNNQWGWFLEPASFLRDYDRLGSCGQLCHDTTSVATAYS
jgi:hypothetical protein